jgi:hypothetical protein
MGREEGGPQLVGDTKYANRAQPERRAGRRPGRLAQGALDALANAMRTSGQAFKVE